MSAEFGGAGTATYPNGDSYNGGYEAGQRDGKGVYRFKSGAFYDGSYAKNLKDGHGLMKYADGSSYDGYWAADARSGVGTYTCESRARARLLSSRRQNREKELSAKANSVWLPSLCRRQRRRI